VGCAVAGREVQGATRAGRSACRDQPLPVAAVAELVARGRLRRLRLEPADGFVGAVGERVHAFDAAPEVVAGAEGIRLAVEDGLDLPFAEEEAFLERMVVLLDRAARDVREGHEADLARAEPGIAQPAPRGGAAVRAGPG